jgi:DNA-binding transcriptional MerR regulator
MTAEVPDKQYFKIGEVAKLASLNTSVLRFWESEFDILKPLKSRTGQRLYSRDDLALVLSIKQLLYDEKLTIAGARSRLCRRQAQGNGETALREKSEQERSILKEIHQELKKLRDSL